MGEASSRASSSNVCSSPMSAVSRTVLSSTSSYSSSYRVRTMRMVSLSGRLTVISYPAWGSHAVMRPNWWSLYTCQPVSVRVTVMRMSRVFISSVPFLRGDDNPAVRQRVYVAGFVRFQVVVQWVPVLEAVVGDFVGSVRLSRIIDRTPAAAPARLAPLRSAPFRSAPRRSAPFRLAWHRMA